MKSIKFALTVFILLLAVVSGWVWANRVLNTQPTNKSTTKPMAVDEKSAAMKIWEASPDGVKYKAWEESDAGKKVQTATDKIRKSVMDYANMEAVITSLSLPPGSRIGYGMMVKIHGEDYMLAFGPPKRPKDTVNSYHNFDMLHSLKVNDKIVIKSRSVSHAPKYAYPIINGDYVERNSKILYKRAPGKGGC